ncbi:unnamed protein product [Effrenium voratum]|nr:unnamed protein product [Effrenium voratum]
MSELSTASDRLNSSQPSGSDSCEEPRSEMAYEESQSGPSDCGSPYLEGTAKETKVDVASAWKNIKYEMSRLELGRDRLSSSSGAARGVSGTFREAVGMNDNGPVIPPKNPQNMRTSSTEESGGYGNFSMSRSVDGHLGFGGRGTLRKGKR